MLTWEHIQEALSRAYFQAIVAKCGLSFGLRDKDYGIDASIHLIQRVEGGYAETGYTLDVQLKSSIRAVVGPTEVVYDMEVDAYRFLREAPVGTPRILVLLVLPDDRAEWTFQSEAELALRQCMYWLSLRGWPETKNKKSIRVHIPRTNVFSVEGLNRLMEKLQKGEDL